MLRRHHFGCLVLATAAWALPACAQDAPPPAQGAALLARLAEQSDDLHHRLPNFACDETVLSEEFHHGKLHHRATFTTTIRAQRNEQGVLEEHIGEMKFEVGPLSALTHHVPSLPLYVSGGFSKALDYVSLKDQLCLTYRFSGGRIDFQAVPQAPADCKLNGTKGFVLLDADGNVTHVERTVATEDSKTRHEVPFAQIDLAPVELNGHIYRLSHHIVAEMPASGDILTRFTADFTNCKLFTATVTIHPGGEAQP